MKKENGPFPIRNLYFWLFTGIVVHTQALPFAVAQKDQQKDWTVYQDSVLRFKHPKEWTTFPPKELSSSTRFWIVGNGSPPPLYSGTSFIYQYLDGREKRPLAQVARSQIGSGRKVISGPTRIALPGGECMKYRVESRFIGCRNDTRGLGENTKVEKCIAATVGAVCYNNRKEYFDIFAQLPLYEKKGNPSEATNKSSQIFDGILKGLEFK